MQQRLPDPHGPPGSPGLPLARPHSQALPPSPQRRTRGGPLRRRTREAQREMDIELEAHWRTLAHRSRVPAPPSLTSAVQRSLAQAEISPDPVSRPARRRAVWRRHRIRFAPLTGESRHDTGMWARHPRLALTGVGTLVVALLCGLGLALDPGKGLAAVGLAGAVLLCALALAHLLSVAVGALLGDTMLAGLATLVYLGLIVLWVQLVRRPVEA